MFDGLNLSDSKTLLTLETWAQNVFASPDFNDCTSCISSCLYCHITLLSSIRYSLSLFWKKLLVYTKGPKWFRLVLHKNPILQILTEIRIWLSCEHCLSQYPIGSLSYALCPSVFISFRRFTFICVCVCVNVSAGVCTSGQSCNFLKMELWVVYKQLWVI